MCVYPLIRKCCLYTDVGWRGRQLAEEVELSDKDYYAGPGMYDPSYFQGDGFIPGPAFFSNGPGEGEAATFDSWVHSATFVT